MTSGIFNFLFALINLITNGPGNANELKKFKNFFFFFFFLFFFFNEIHRFINEIHRIINEIHRSKPKPTSVASENVLAI